MDDALVKQNINVCLIEQTINNGKTQNKTDNTHRNCGQCEKCLRTMLQLDIFGRLNEYKNVFNLSQWPKIKYVYLAKVLANKDKDLMYNDMASTIGANEYPVPTKVLFRSLVIRCKQFLQSII